MLIKVMQNGETLMQKGGEIGGENSGAKGSYIKVVRKWFYQFQKSQKNLKPFLDRFFPTD